MAGKYGYGHDSGPEPEPPWPPETAWWVWSAWLPHHIAPQTTLASGAAPTYAKLVGGRAQPATYWP